MIKREVVINFLDVIDKLYMNIEDELDNSGVSDAEFNCFSDECIKGIRVDEEGNLVVSIEIYYTPSEDITIDDIFDIKCTLKEDKNEPKPELEDLVEEELSEVVKGGK